MVWWGGCTPSYWRTSSREGRRFFDKGSVAIEVWRSYVEVDDVTGMGEQWMREVVVGVGEDVL